MRAPDLSKSRYLFVYGTLQSSEVLIALLGRDLPKRTTVAENISIYKTLGKVYPFAVICRGKRTQGAIIEPKTSKIWAILDYFEDPRYCLSLTETDQGEAWCYLDPENIFPSDGPWNYEEFRKKHLDDYVAGCKRIRDRYLCEHPEHSLR